MMKLIIWIALAWLAYSIWKAGRAASARRAGLDSGARRAGSASGAHSPQAEAPQSLRMVACGRCGVYLPEAEALRDGTAWYCGEEHARQAGARGNAR